MNNQISISVFAPPVLMNIFCGVSNIIPIIHASLTASRLIAWWERMSGWGQTCSESCCRQQTTQATCEAARYVIYDHCSYCSIIPNKVTAMTRYLNTFLCLSGVFVPQHLVCILSIHELTRWSEHVASCSCAQWLESVLSVVALHSETAARRRCQTSVRI